MTSCASSPIDLISPETLLPGNGVAFGQVVMRFDGKPQESFSSVFGESTMKLILQPEQGSGGILYPLKDQGHFFWHLPPGAYTVAAFDGRTPGFSSLSVQGRVFATFRVAPGQATYIGTLAIAFHGSRYHLAVHDDFVSAAAQWQSRFPGLETPINKDLMTMEARR